VPAAIHLSAMQNPDDCVACQVGKFQGKDTTDCTDCTYPATTRTSASVYCTDCAQGFCFNGFRSDGHADCIKCPSAFATTQPGGYMRGFTDGCRCEPGYDGYSWSCKPCRPGSYKSEITETSDFDLFVADITNNVVVGDDDTCISCPDGSYNDQWASTSADFCEQCSLHSSTYGDTSRCICNMGYYDTDTSPQALCQPCPADFYNDEVGKESIYDCKPCPDVNSYSVPASDDVTNCTCNAGFEGDWTGCTACPVDTYATIHDDVCVSCPQGTFTYVSLRTGLDKCVCPANKYGIGLQDSQGRSLQTTSSAMLDIRNWTYRGEPYYDWQLHDGAPHHCLDCPPDSITDVDGDGNPDGLGDPGATARTQCKCLVGLSGDPANGIGCLSCPGNTFPWETALYCSCNAGYYDDFSGGDSDLFIRTTDETPANCTKCPDNSHSEKASIGVAECTCNNGYFGQPAPGNVDSPCVGCPANSHSYAARPVNVTFCTCNDGFSGDPGDSVPCVECVTAKDPNSHTHISTDTDMCTCNAGYYGDLYNETMGSSCFACSSNTFNNQTSRRMLSDCIACPQHSTTDATGSSDFTDCKCDPGYYHSGEVCVACSEGKYQPSRGAHSCIACIDNSISEVASDAATDCECKAGFYRSGGPSPGGTCADCPADTWKVFVGDAACDPCTGNSTSSADRTSCVCNAGYYGGPEPEFNGGCAACPADTKQPEIGQHTVSACIPCKRDATAPPGSAMCVCKANTYGDGNSDLPTDNCTACPTGAVSNQDSRLVTDCTCEEGLYGNFAGLNEAQAKNASCSACSPNEVTSMGAVSSADCFCARGYYGDPANGVACQECPPNSTSPEATTSFSGCVCKADFYGNPTVNISCLKCPEDAVAPEGSLQLQDCNCRQGYFGTPGGAITTTPAPVPPSTPAPGGSANASANASATASAPAPAPSHARCLACNKCPETHFGVLLEDVTSASSLDQWGPSSGFDPQLSGTWFQDAAALACRVAFSVTAQDALLWHFGDSQSGASLGIRDASSTPTLRLRAGNASISAANNIAVLDVTDFPADGRFHEVSCKSLCDTALCVTVAFVLALRLSGARNAVYADLLRACLQNRFWLWSPALLAVRGHGWRSSSTEFSEARQQVLVLVPMDGPLKVQTRPLHKPRLMQSIQLVSPLKPGPEAPRQSGRILPCVTQLCGQNAVGKIGPFQLGATGQAVAIQVHSGLHVVLHAPRPGPALHKPLWAPTAPPMHLVRATRAILAPMAAVLAARAPWASTKTPKETSSAARVRMADLPSQRRALCAQTRSVKPAPRTPFRTRRAQGSATANVRQDSTATPAKEWRALCVRQAPMVRSQRQREPTACATRATMETRRKISHVGRALRTRRQIPP